MFASNCCALSKPFIRIIEQPSKSLRFRYECEGRPGTLPGASSTPDNKTPFAIEVQGYEGPAVILVSCVTKDEPYRPHPHNLVGQNCKKGVCTFKTNLVRDVSVKFPKLAVQCVKRKDAEEALRIRAQENIDPFRTKFKHVNDIKSIDLNVVRLCFQVFIESKISGQYTAELEPVVSDPIFNKKTIPEPLIYKLSHCCCFADGDKPEVILLCTKVSKNDVKVRFFEEDRDKVVWEAFGAFQPSEIYNQTAICFKPPPYYNQDITNPVTVFVQLRRPSDGVTSQVVPFQYLPLEAKPGALKRRRKTEDRVQFFDQLLEISGGMNVMNDLSKDSWLQQAPEPQSSKVLDLDKLLNIDCQQMELQPIHLSSGELEAAAGMDHMSGSLPENLSLSDLLI